MVLATMALSGWPLALLLRVTADGVFNESVYFTVQSGALLWLFAAVAVGPVATVGLSAPRGLPSRESLLSPSRRRWSSSGARRRRPPTSCRRASSGRWTPSSRSSRPGDVVLMRPFSRYPPPPIVFVGRRVPFTHYMPYMRQFAPRGGAPGEGAGGPGLLPHGGSGRGPRPSPTGSAARFVYLFGPQAIAPGDRGDARDASTRTGDARLYRIPEG